MFTVYNDKMFVFTFLCTVSKLHYDKSFKLLICGLVLGMSAYNDRKGTLVKAYHTHTHTTSYMGGYSLGSFLDTRKNMKRKQNKENYFDKSHCNAELSPRSVGTCECVGAVKSAV